MMKYKTMNNLFKRKMDDLSTILCYFVDTDQTTNDVFDGIFSGQYSDYKMDVFTDNTKNILSSKSGKKITIVITVLDK